MLQIGNAQPHLADFEIDLAIGPSRAQLAHPPLPAID